MSKLIKETVTLAPGVVVEKALYLKNLGMYKQALELLQENCIQFDVYDTRVEAKLPAVARQSRKYHFQRKG